MLKSLVVEESTERLHRNDYSFCVCVYRQRSLQGALNGTSTFGWEKRQARFVCLCDLQEYVLDQIMEYYNALYPS